MRGKEEKQKKIQWSKLDIEKIKTKEDVEKLHYELMRPDIYSTEEEIEKRKCYVTGRMKNRDIQYLFEILFKCKAYRFKGVNWDCIDKHFRKKRK